MAINTIINSFNAGELSPHILGRTDLAKYYSGCRTMENFIALRYGGSMKRPGSYCVAEVKTSSKKVRLIGFQYSTVQAYILEFGDQYIRFYKDGGQIVTEDACSGNAGTAAVDNSLNQYLGADCLFDDRIEDPSFWETTTAFPHWAKYSFATAKTIVKYTISAGPYHEGRMPKTWTFEASATGVFGGEEVTLDTQTDITTWAANEKKSYTFSNETAYKYYRLNISAGNDAVLRIYEVEMMESTDGSVTYAYEIDSPYAEADLFDLHITQSADVMYIFHPSYLPRKLSRYGHTSWTLTQGDFRYGPFLARNDLCADPRYEEITITPSYPAWVTSTPYVVNNHVYSGNKTLDNAAALDKGGGLVGLPSTAHGFTAGDQIRIDGTTNYDACYTVLSDTSANQIVVAATFVAETFAGTETAKGLYKCIKDHTSSAGDEPGVGGSWQTYWEFTQRLLGNNMILTTNALNPATKPQLYDIFRSTHVGALWQLEHNLGDEFIEGTFSAVAQSQAIRCEGTWNFTTHGDWNGKMQLQRSYDNGKTWHPYHTYTSANDKIYEATGEEVEEDVLYRVAMVARTAGTCTWCFSLDDSNIKGVVKINDFTSTTQVIAEVQKELGNMYPTIKWSEGAWSDERGYAATGTFFEGRLWPAGSTYKPQTMWASKTRQYENFRTGILAEHALAYSIEAAEVNAIRWLVSHEIMAIGTMGAEWKLGSADPADTMTPENPMYPRRQTTYGSSGIQARLVANDVIFVQNDLRTVRAFRYVFEQGEAGGYRCEDITMYADHITESGIVCIAVQTKPEPVLWCVRTDGQLIGLTFEPGQIIFGWHRHVTDGEIESAAVISGTSEDEVWISVKRTVGTTKRFVEQIQPRDWGSDQKDCFFVDCGITFDGGSAYNITGATKAKPVVVTCTAHPFSNGDQVKITGVVGMTQLNDNVYTVANKGDNDFELKDADNEVEIDGTGFTAYTSGGTAQKVENTFTGLTYLEGKTVAILADGASHPQKVVSGGSITLDYFANKVHVGLGFAGKLQPMPLEMTTREGTAQGRKKRIHEVVARFDKTVGGKIGPDENNLHEIQFREPSDAMGAAIPLYSGLKKANHPGDYDDEGNILIVHDEPLPCTVESIVSKWGLYG